MITRGTLSDLVLPDWYAVYSREFEIEAKKQVGLRLLNVNDTKKKSERETGVGRFPRFMEKTEGAGITELSMSEMSSVEYQPKTYAARSRVTKEMIEDDLTSVINSDRPKMLLEAGLATVEEINALLFENGFSASYTQSSGGFMVANRADGGDGKQLFATDHAYANATTWSNTSSTNVDLSESTLFTALTALARQKDISGENLISNTPNILLVAPENYKNAYEIIKSDKVSDSANNAKNYYQGLGLEIISWPFLSTYTNAWYLLSAKHFLKFWWRVKGQMFNYLLENQDEDIGVRMRFANGWSLPQGTWASRGSV